ncbi:MAG TPA: ABC transporter ATP-binding protein [Flavobacteriales bacterium]|nr:ABC transporter ATP-binding protein [Flavobacteriales bacterium]
MAEQNVLSVDGLSKRYGERVLFEDLTFGIGRGQRVALVARNGTGKSTLMRALCDLEPADAGRVAFMGGVRWGFLRQEADLDPESTLLDTLYIGDNPAVIALRNYEKELERGAEGPKFQEASDAMDRTEAWNYEARAREILGKLNIHDLSRKVGTLSGGEKRRAALAAVLLEAPELLFLDEPTNHLDLDMIAWLEKRLSSTNSTIFMITHDRYFLENVCDRILELENYNLYSYKGNFSYYLEKRDERRNNAQASKDRAKKVMTRELAWMRSTPSARTGKSKSRIDRFYEIKKEASIRLQEDPMHISVIPERLGGKIVELHKISCAYGERVLFEGITHHFKRGERIGIVGHNGSGKTSLLNMILGNQDPNSGKVVVGDTVVFGHYHQLGGNFSEEWKVIDAVREIADFIPLKGGAKLTAAQLLERFLFPKHMHYQYIKVLSGGERKRLHLLRVLMKNPNFLILDEPTNDLDIFTLAVLEEFLLSFTGCLLVVSHDRYFMDKIVEHVWAVGEKDSTGAHSKGIRDYPGNYTQYRLNRKEKLEAEALAISNAKKAVTISATVKGDYSERLSFKEKFEFEQLGPRIAELEKMRDKMSTELESCNVHEDLIRLGEELGKVSAELDESEMRWLELSERA